ncbi:MAG: MgtC/SapB family protein [Rhodoferax sp.]|jgi:putative Mg2+ transporter-C (MgtC) family protein|nr:MgtC/SapB family protein [Rhodoferax sp.]
MDTQASLWSRIGATVAQEFSDVADVEQITRLVLRLALAALLGGILGFEREAKGKDAGVRTHMLVCMGAAMFVLVSQQAGVLAGDMSRVIQGVIAGVGFLGAGTILKSDDEQRVKGLTTAAGIWLTAAVGVAAGMGRETTAILSALLALATLGLVPLLARLLHRAPTDASSR